MIVLMGALAAPAVAQAPPEGRQRGDAGDAAKKDDAPKKDDADIPIPAETSSVTKHDWTAGSRAVHYTATAGNLLIRDDKNKGEWKHLLCGVHGGWGWMRRPVR